MPLQRYTEKPNEKGGPEIPTNAEHQQLNTTLSSASLTDEDRAIKQDDQWVLPGVGTFTKKATYDFRGHDLPSELLASDYLVQDRNSETAEQIPYNHKFQASNVKVANDFLNLIVPGDQNPASPTRDNRQGVPISCAEVITAEGNIRYASIRTRAIFSTEPGTCHGLFYYKYDTQEADIEYLTDPASSGNDGKGYTIPLWYSNQANATSKEPTQLSKVPPGHPPGHPPIDPTTSIHEHRIDWTPDHIEYFFDSHSQAKFTTNVPHQPGHWNWNNLANGDPGMSRPKTIPASHAVLIAAKSMVWWSTS